jgi:hypothetical protein
MAGIDKKKRVENLERRFGGDEPVRINVVYEGDEEPAYGFMLTPSGERIPVEASEKEGA